MEQKLRKEIHRFTKTVWKYYQEHGRTSLPWRRTKNPYRILISEIMLQQTQVDRVIPKYKEFLKRFPTTKALAQASNKDVLLLWKGLGYNNRALRLKQTAEIIEKEYKGKFPKNFEELISLPGIGPATAGDLLAFAWNIPMPIIETNIRTVYIHHFFPKNKNVSDKEILQYVAVSLDTDNPRDWYWALMDYGTHLKKQGVKNNNQSKHYTKQSRFKGSNREVRSVILQTILEKGPIKEKDVLTNVLASITTSEEVVRKNLNTMGTEGIFKKTKQGFTV